MALLLPAAFLACGGADRSESWGTTSGRVPAFATVSASAAEGLNERDNEDRLGNRELVGRGDSTGISAAIDVLSVTLADLIRRDSWTVTLSPSPASHSPFVNVNGDTDETHGDTDNDGD